MKRLSGKVFQYWFDSYMDEACLCNRIGLIFKGEILATDEPVKLVKRHDKRLVAFRGDNMYKLLQDVRKEESVYSCFTFGDALHVTLKEGKYPVEVLAERLKGMGHRAVEWYPIEAGIEDYS
ncbi:MAG: hypothetical protein ACLUDU_00195 [Butyricimonas faecihominis]